MTRDNPNCDTSIVSKFTDAGFDILLRHSHKNFHILLLYAADNYMSIGRYDDAETLLFRIIEESETPVLGHLMALAEAKRLQKEYIKSSRVYLKIAERCSRSEFSTYIDCLLKIADNLAALEFYEQSEEFLLKAFDELSQSGAKSWDLQFRSIFYQLVRIYSKTKQYPKQLAIIESEYEFLEGDIFEKWLFLSSDQRDLYWRGSNLAFHAAPAVYWALNPEADMSKLYSMMLLKKGLLLNSEIELRNHLGDDYAQLREVKEQLNREWSDSLFYLTETMERKLLRGSKAYGDYTRNLKLKWNDVQAQLSDNDVAIEFIDFVVPNSDSTMYAALVVRKGWATPKMITLFEERQLEKLTRAGAEKSYIDSVGKQITNLVWRSLEEYLNEGDNIYFSPSGMLHQKAIESLSTDDGRLMSEKYNLHRVSSTREICYKKPTPKYEKVVLYGGLFYDLDDHIMVAESRNYTSSMSRGFEADSVFRGSWSVLPGAKRELMSIAKLRPNATIFEGEAGNEESFRALSGRGNEIIHVATHGFFLPIEKARNGNYNSMSRSGLILSGGNRAWRGDAVPDGIEDGVLTAAEISTLDLRGADLVVLSACDTGLGEVSGEGVFGLQRAFKMAGAGTLVMSLWKVHDDATALMMSEFYANLFAGKSKRESFLTAQASVRAKFILPHYWAAFIMLD